MPLICVDCGDQFATMDQIAKHGFAVHGRPALDPRPSGCPRGYERLEDVLVEALKQAAEGKGKERHARDGQAFHDQRIVAVNLELGSTHGAVFQAVKKLQESARLAWPAARRELLGAIVYAAATVIVGDELAGKTE